MNHVMRSRIVELSEVKTRFERIKNLVNNWKYVAALSIGLFTAKIAVEQLLMIFLRHNV
jgi:hypothetical protein